MHGREQEGGKKLERRIQEGTKPHSVVMSTASALGLSPSEEAATAQFMSLVNEWRSVRGFEPVSSAAAVKFLMARKFRHVFAFFIKS